MWRPRRREDLHYIPRNKTNRPSRKGKINHGPIEREADLIVRGDLPAFNNHARSRTLSAKSCRIRAICDQTKNNHLCNWTKTHRILLLEEGGGFHEAFETSAEYGLRGEGNANQELFRCDTGLKNNLKQFLRREKAYCC